MDPTSKASNAGKAAREAKLAQALRANLRRRKVSESVSVAKTDPKSEREG